MTEEIELQAAEYVLGTLSRDERAAFEALLATNDDAQRAVDTWQQRLAPLAATLHEQAPPAAVWSAIERRLQESSGESSSTLPIEALALSTAELRASRNRWRFCAIAASAFAACIALFAIDRVVIEKREAATAYVAVVNRGGDLPALIIRVDLATHSVFVRPVATQVPEGRSLELWYIGQGKAPKSMGLVDKEPRKIPLPTSAHVEQASFAVTVEPLGGSPTGKATGPIVYSGQLLKE
ncbi:MAG: anti-sigma factor domain-containing protein [Methylovirgula sp.]